MAYAWQIRGFHEVPGLEVRIAKIGRAFAKSEFGEKLFALEDDIGHPSPLGSLLEACTVALELWGKTKKLAYANVVPHVSVEDAEKCLSVAASVTSARKASL
eukprot:GEMP01083696.1.p3 GENE.GEMP01083696.1~~GEMP01083696.1.p3  ORF type:complete len:102 (+),score=21.17 GEMP01083696.1:579-884(+)